MAQDYASSITGSHIRVTALNQDGSFRTGAGAAYVTQGFISASFTPEYEEGDEFTQKNAAGRICATFKAPDTLKRVNLSIALCAPDPEFTHIIAGGTLLGENSEGWASPLVGDDPVPYGAAIEVWSNAIVDGKSAGTNPYFHWIFPYTKMRESGERVVQNDVLATEFEGWGVGNVEFGSGPMAPLWAFPQNTNSPYAYARSTGVPEETGLVSVPVGDDSDSGSDQEPGE